MKSIALWVVMATVTMAANAATPGEEPLAEKSGCLTCHAVDTKKIGPAFKDAARTFKGKSNAEAFAKWKEAKPHAAVKASEDDVKTVLKWVMTLQ